MTAELGLRAVPMCELDKCRRNGTIRVQINKTGWPVPGTVHICAQHFPAFTVRAEAARFTWKLV